MAVRLRVRIRAAGRRQAPVDTAAVANSGFESEEPEVVLPRSVAKVLGLWPPPSGARTDRFESPIASATMITIPRALCVSLPGFRSAAVTCNAVVSRHETEVVLNDWAVDALGLQLVAVGRGLYRVGRRGRIQKSAPAEHW